MDGMSNTLKKLCMPSYIYFIFSMLVLVIAVIFLFSGLNVFCEGKGCTPGTVILMILLKFIFIVFWTWLLNVICKGGASFFSWFLVLFPFVLIIVGLLSALIMK